MLISWENNPNYNCNSEAWRCTVLIDEKYKFGLLLYSVLVLKRNSAVRTKLEIQGE